MDVQAAADGRGSGGAALVEVDGGDKACCEGGDGVRNLICPESDKSFHSASSPAVGLDLENELPMKWLVTARRGRAPTAAYAVTVSAAPAAVLEPTRSEEEDAAMILLGMSSGDAKEPAKLHMELMSGLEQLELPDDHVADSAALDLDPETEVEQQAEEPAEVERIIPEVEQALPVLEHVAATVTAAPEVEKPSELEPVRDKKRLVSPAAKMPKMRRLDDIVRTLPNLTAEAAEVQPPSMRIPSLASGRMYACVTCGKSFPTHQALGGHSVSHRKVSKFSGEQQLEGRHAVAHALHNIMAQHHHQRQGGAVVPGAARWIGGSRDIPPPLPAARDPTHHPCSRCGQVFSSGQALGGHMRKHWHAEREHTEAAETAAAVAASSAAALAAAAAARPIVPPRDFDLNESPTEE